MRRLQGCLPWMRNVHHPGIAGPMCSMICRHQLSPLFGANNQVKVRCRRWQSAGNARHRSTSTMSINVAAPPAAGDAPAPTIAEPSLFSVKVNTCSDLYTDMHETGRSRKKPLTGVDFDVVYADTMPSAPSSVPVVLALHGVAGSHSNFYPLLPYLANSERNNPPVRIVMPNFPGCGYTPQDAGRVFEHSDEERAHLVLDFLKALDISRVKLLIAHSAGANTALSLHETSKIFQSFLFVNPAALRPVKMLRPVALYRVLLSLMNVVPFVRQLVSVVQQFIFKDFDLFKTLPVDNLEVVARTLLFVDYEKVKRAYMTLALQRQPLVLAISENDAIVGTDRNAELMKFLDFDQTSVCRYDAAGAMSSAKVSDVTFPKVLLFNSRSHLLPKAYPEILANEILNLLTQLDSRSASVTSSKVPHSTAPPRYRGPAESN